MSVQQPINNPSSTSASTIVPIKHIFVNIAPASTIQELRDNVATSFGEFSRQLTSQLKNITTIVSSTPTSLTIGQQIQNAIVSNSVAPSSTGGNGTSSLPGLQYPLEFVLGEIAIAPQGISNAQLGSAAVAANNLQASSITQANGAIAANAIISSNIHDASVSVLTAGTSIFSGDVYLSRGTGSAVIALTNSGIFLYGSSTGTAAVTSQPYTTIQSGSCGIFGGTSTATITGTGTLFHPSIIVQGSQLTLFADTGNITTAPYFAVTPTAVQMVYGSFTNQISASQIQLTYASGPSLTMNSVQIELQNGSYNTIVNPGSVQLNGPNGQVALNAGGLLIQDNGGVNVMTLTPTVFTLQSGTNAKVSITSTMVSIGNGTSNAITLDGTGHASFTTSAFGTTTVIQGGLIGANQISLTGFLSSTIGPIEIGTPLGSGYQTNYLHISTNGTFYLWVDSSGRLRIKSGAPTSDTDGTVVGTQT